MYVTFPQEVVYGCDIGYRMGDDSTNTTVLCKGLNWEPFPTVCESKYARDYSLFHIVFEGSFCIVYCQQGTVFNSYDIQVNKHYIPAPCYSCKNSQSQNCIVCFERLTVFDLG